MGEHDEDSLDTDYDLSAWEVPPPAAGLADAVVRRAREHVPHAVVTPRSLRRWVIGAGSLAALVAILAFALWGIERAPESGSGVVATTAPQTLDLGRSSAVLDSGAQLTWTRRGADVAVSQSRGAVTWRVSDEDNLVIDAALASIEARGASLRVEVSMNRSDVRAMGVGSAAAIVVSLVTVIVYEGHVKATSNGQTVNIQPGATMTFGEKPTPAEQLSVGGSTDDDARKRIAELEREVAKLRFELLNRDAETLREKETDKKEKTENKEVPTKSRKDANDTTTETQHDRSCDEVSCVLTNYEGTCCTKYKKKTATCDAGETARKGDDLLANGMDSAALVQFEASLACKADPAVSKKALMAACRSKQAAKAKKHLGAVPAATRSSYAQICLRYGIDIEDGTSASCDAEELKKKGDSYLSNGMDAAALEQFEASLRCKFSTGVIKNAFVAACRSKQAAKAKLYYAKLPQQGNYAEICKRFNIDVLGK